jgi:hypothetical protein
MRHGERGDFSLMDREAEWNDVFAPGFEWHTRDDLPDAGVRTGHEGRPSPRGDIAAAAEACPPATRSAIHLHYRAGKTDRPRNRCASSRSWLEATCDLLAHRRASVPALVVGQSAAKYLCEDDRVVVLGVVGGVDEREGSFPRPSS